MKNNLKIFYNEKQSLENSGSIVSHSKMPKLFIDRIKNKECYEIMDFEPLSRDILKTAHSSQYVDDLMDLKIDNGYKNRSPEVRDTYPWLTGSFLHAAEYAVRNNAITMSPSIAFHHVEYDENPIGFGGFNGLMIAARYLYEHKLAKKIAIVDLDTHWGNGTQNIIEKLDIDYVEHYSFCKNISDYATHEGYDGWFDHFKQYLEMNMTDVDVIFFQAGVDSHIDDAWGRYLTTEEMRRRDWIVFEFAKNHKIPLVWNLAGGYQDDDKVLDLHENTFDQCIEIFFHAVDKNNRMRNYLKTMKKYYGESTDKESFFHWLSAEVKDQFNYDLTLRDVENA